MKYGHTRRPAAARRTAAGNEVSLYRLKTVAGTVIAGVLVLFVAAAPAHADAGEAREALRISGVRLSGLGAEVRVRVAQDGTRAHRAISSRRSSSSSCTFSVMIGTSWVGATFQFGRGGVPSTSLASKWLRRSPVALLIT
jgi:hypothetical protein